MVFLVKSYKIEVITSLIETLELPNFGHITTSTIKFDSCDKILLVTSWIEIMTSRRPSVTIFADIIKIVTMVFIIIFEDSKKVRRIRNYEPKCNLCLYFLI